MLDLDPPVELEEVDVAAVDEELGRAGIPVVDRLGEGRGGRRDPLAGDRVEPERR